MSTLAFVTSRLQKRGRKSTIKQNLKKDVELLESRYWWTLAGVQQTPPRAKVNFDTGRVRKQRSDTLRVTQNMAHLGRALAVGVGQKLQEGNGV